MKGALSRRLGVAMCSGCLSKMVEIDRLKREVGKRDKRIAALEAKLGRQARTQAERPFGDSTPSSKEPFKANAPEEDRKKRGGARVGHCGHGRSVPPPTGEPEPLAAPLVCPGCGAPTESHKVEERHVRDHIPERIVDRTILVETRRCRACAGSFEAEVPGVLPRRKYTNQFLADAAAEHYLAGRTQGDVCSRFGIGAGAFNGAMQWIAELLRPCMDQLVLRFLAAPVRFSDETGHREDGAGCYSWLLSSADASIFQVGKSRAGAVVLDLLAPSLEGVARLAGVLVVDRYVAYGPLPFHLQYCFAHLLRDVQALAKDFPEVPEVQVFCAALASQLAAAMRLHCRPLPDDLYYPQATAAKSEIIRICTAQARHPGVQAIQTIFRENSHRLYHWADDRRVPADNNYSERSIRPLVIARKISFGTQSERGSATRSVIMSVLHTLRKQGGSPAEKLREALDLHARDPGTDIAAFLFPARPPQPQLRCGPATVPTLLPR